MALAVMACVVLFTTGCGGAGDGDSDGGGGDGGNGGGVGTPATHVRKEIHSLDPTEIANYRAGVALMKSRPATDPTSWTYQANIHGVPNNNTICSVTPGGPQPAYATCQHGNFFFLSWHRMYLYYFERILRAAVQEATGDPDAEFNLPYWDYENSSFRALPEPYRTPADSSNSLFVAQRAANCNNVVAGNPCISASDASDTVAMTRVPFCNCPSGQSCADCQPGLFPDQTFGGQFTPVPLHGGRAFGELESQPHNVIHVAIGGSFGWMSYPSCAARDPIFWNHHANIDRLWQVWLNQNANRMNPLGEANWRTQQFTFFDENGTQIQMTGCEILNMATQLDYVYDGLPVENVVLCGPAPMSPDVSEGAAPALLVSSDEEVRSLGQAPVSASVAVPSPSVGPATPQRLRVVVEGLKLKHPGAVYRVYLNLPAGAEPDPESEYFVGNIAIFGEPHADDPGGSRSFDITEQVAALRESGEWDGSVELTFVRGNPGGPGPAGAEQPLEHMSFSRISVVQQ